MNSNKKDHHIWWDKHVKGKIKCAGIGGGCSCNNECYSCGRCDNHCFCDSGPIKPPKEWPEEDE